MFQKKFKLGSKYVGSGCHNYLITAIDSNTYQTVNKEKKFIMFLYPKIKKSILVTT